MLALRRRSHLGGVVAGALVATCGAAMPAAADHQRDQGSIHTGVRSQDEARAYPCGITTAGGLDTNGPVVCLAKRSDAWRIDYEDDGVGCSYDAAGWRGRCIFAIDEGDQLRLWGTSGIPTTPFTLTWLHDAGDAGQRPGEGITPPDAGSADVSGPVVRDPSTSSDEAVVAAGALPPVPELMGLYTDGPHMPLAAGGAASHSGPSTHATSVSDDEAASDAIEPAVAVWRPVDDGPDRLGALPAILSVGALAVVATIGSRRRRIPPADRWETVAVSRPGSAGGRTTVGRRRAR